MGRIFSKVIIDLPDEDIELLKINNKNSQMNEVQDSLKKANYVYDKKRYNKNQTSYGLTEEGAKKLIEIREKIYRRNLTYLTAGVSISGLYISVILFARKTDLLAFPGWLEIALIIIVVLLIFSIVASIQYRKKLAN